MSKDFDHVPNAAWHALRSVAHFLSRHPRAVLGVLMSEAGYWILWPMLNSQPVQLPHPTAVAFFTLSTAGLATALRLVRATLRARADRRGNLTGSVSVDAEVEAGAGDYDALNDYQERRYHGEA